MSNQGKHRTVSEPGIEKRELTPPEKPELKGDFITDKGKNIVIEKDPNGYGMVVVKFREGGQVPEILQGMYTNHLEASKAITKYLDSRPGARTG